MRLITGMSERGYEGFGTEKRTHIDSLKDVEDLYLLASTEKDDMPLLINHKFGYGSEQIYKRVLAGEEISFGGIKRTCDNSYYVYYCGPIDFWDFWVEIDMEDLLSRLGLYDQVYNVMRIAAHHCGWEGDVRSGPFLSVVPTGDCEPEATMIVAFKQDNNGDTMVGCKAPLPIPSMELKWTPNSAESSEDW